jgi:hypothetical protein
MFKGYKTIAFGVLVAGLPSILQYAGGIDWTQFGVSPVAGAAIGGAVAILRWFTTTPVFNRAVSPEPETEDTADATSPAK